MCEAEHAACGSCTSVFSVPKSECVWAKGDRTAQGTSASPYRVMRVPISSMLPDEGATMAPGSRESMKGWVPTIKGGSRDRDNARTDTTQSARFVIDRPTVTGMLTRSSYGDLPSVAVVLHVVKVFFDRVPLVTNMISRKQFMSNIERPRTSPHHPSAALVHAILAITARYLPKHLLSTWAYRPAQTQADFYLAHQQTPLYHFQTFHRDTAVALLPATMHKDTYKSADIVTAHILINVLNYWSGEEIKALSGAAMITRSLVHMGFHESLDTRHDTWEGSSRERPDDPKDPLEQALRCRAWWMAWLVDKHVSFLSNSPSSVPDEDVYMELPTCHHDFVKGNAGVQKGVQSLQSPNVYFENPPLHQDGFNMLIKATALFSEASTFLRDYARQSETDAPYIKQKRLWEMIAKIDGFWAAFPPRLKDPTALDRMDRDLIAAMWTGFAVQVILGEPAIPGDWHGQLAKLCLDAIDNAFALFMKRTSFDASLFHAGIYQMAFHSARALIRFTDAAVDAGDQASAEKFAGLAQMIRHAMQENGTQNRLGVILHAQLDDMLRLQAELANLKRLLATQPGIVAA